MTLSGSTSAEACLAHLPVNDSECELENALSHYVQRRLQEGEMDEVGRDPRTQRESATTVEAGGSVATEMGVRITCGAA